MRILPMHSETKSLLVIAHPGHELRLHRWMELRRPDVFIITDGSGSTGIPRGNSSRALIEGMGAVLLPGSCSIPDQRLYEALRLQDAEFFRALALRIGTIVSHDHGEVICDGLEGFNTTHDLCHVAARAAAGRRGLPVYDFPLDANPCAWPATQALLLEEKELMRKLAAAEAYPELTDEVRRAIGNHGRSAFAHEVLRLMPPVEDIPSPPSKPPFYETFGEKRVREGVYREVIRWETHVRPMAEILWSGA